MHFHYILVNEFEQIFNIHKFGMALYYSSFEWIEIKQQIYRLKVLHLQRAYNKFKGAF